MHGRKIVTESRVDNSLFSRTTKRICVADHFFPQGPNSIVDVKINWGRQNIVFPQGLKSGEHLTHHQIANMTTFSN